MAQPKYLQAIKKALEPKSGKKDFTPAYKTWKPEIGKTYNIRFIQAIDNGSDEPFYEILFYRGLDQQKRYVAPYQFDMMDPIKAEFDNIRKDNWDVAKNLKARESFFGILLDRACPEEGPQVFEFSKEVRDQIYSKLQSADYQEEDVFDVDRGFDFEVIVSPKPDRMWNGKPVRNFSFSLRMKSTPLAKTEEQKQEILDKAPRLQEIYKSWTKDAAFLREELKNFYDRLSGAAIETESQSATDVSGGVVIEDESAKEAKFTAPTMSTPTPSSASEALNKLNALKGKKTATA
jgi:hypothetical protein